MSAEAPTWLVLGPQRPVRNLGDAVAAAGLPDGPVAVVSAGWQEAEGDIEDVHELVRRPLRDLGLYQRAETLLAADPVLREAHRARQDALIAQQRLYRGRLRHLKMAARHTLEAEGDRALIAAEQRHAMAQLRALDQHHLLGVRKIQDAFYDAFDPRRNEALAEHAAEIEDVVAGCETVLVTGGNVAIILNRMRLFGVERLLAGKHLVAWSGGAMALSDRIVLFHDRTPIGRRDPEVLVDGIGAIPGFVFLPDAARRLKRKDRTRTRLMSRRFSPATCAALYSGAVLRFEGGRLVHAESAERLTARGRHRRMTAE